MRLLLDTHALFWWLIDYASLSPRAAEAIADSSNEIAVSAVSAVEITTKVRVGKLPRAAHLARYFEESVAAAGFRPLSISLAHGRLAGSLDIPHKDPFDRLLIAQAILEPMVLVSNERVFDSFGVQRLW